MRARRPTRAATPPGLHVLLYDDTCDFCTASALLVERHSRVPVTLLGISRSEGSGFLTGFEREEVEAGVHLVTPDGTEYHDGDAAVRAARLMRFGWVAGVLNLPGLDLLRDLGYHLVSVNRRHIPIPKRWL